MQTHRRAESVTNLCQHKWYRPIFRKNWRKEHRTKHLGAAAPKFSPRARRPSGHSRVSNLCFQPVFPTCVSSPRFQPAFPARVSNPSLRVASWCHFSARTVRRSAAFLEREAPCEMKHRAGFDGASHQMRGSNTPPHTHRRPDRIAQPRRRHDSFTSPRMRCMSLNANGRGRCRGRLR